MSVVGDISLLCSEKLLLSVGVRRLVVVRFVGGVGLHTR